MDNKMITAINKCLESCEPDKHTCDTWVHAPSSIEAWHEKYAEVPHHEKDWELLLFLKLKTGKTFFWISSKTGISRTTIRKYIRGHKTRKRRTQTVRDEWRGRVHEIWSEISTETFKPTAKEIYDILVEKYGYNNSTRTIRLLVGELKGR